MKKLYRNKTTNLLIYGEFLANEIILKGRVVYPDKIFKVGFSSAFWNTRAFENININNLSANIKLEVLKNL